MVRREAEVKTLVIGPIIKKTDSTAIRMSVITIDGVELFDLRQMYRTRDSNDWLPTSKGFTLPVDNTALKALSRFKRFVTQELGEE